MSRARYYDQRDRYERKKALLKRIKAEWRVRMDRTRGLPDIDARADAVQGWVQSNERLSRFIRNSAHWYAKYGRKP